MWSLVYWWNLWWKLVSFSWSQKPLKNNKRTWFNLYFSYSIIFDDIQINTSYSKSRRGELELIQNEKYNGGFIAQFSGLVEQKNIINIEIEKIYGITLLSEDNDIPSWNPIIENNINIDILSGIDNTGNICNPKNLLDFIKKIKKNTCDIITCDGGIDYSDDYNNQELASYEFMYNEIVLSLHLQCDGGTLIIKMFDILYYSSIQLIYILYSYGFNYRVFAPLIHIAFCRTGHDRFTIQPLVKSIN